MNQPPDEMVGAALREVATWHESDSTTPALASLVRNWNKDSWVLIHRLLDVQTPQHRSLALAILRGIDDQASDETDGKPGLKDIVLGHLDARYDPAVRWWAISAVGYHAMVESLPSLMTMATDPSPIVRMGVASAVVSLVNQDNRVEVLTALGELAGDSDADVRDEAIGSLMELAGAYEYLGSDPENRS